LLDYQNLQPKGSKEVDSQVINFNLTNLDKFLKNQENSEDQAVDSAVAFNQKQELQTEIQTKKTELEDLISSIKEKLKSNSKNPLLSNTKRQERNEKLESLFKNIPTNQEEFVKNLENIKKDLSKKQT